MYWLYGFVTGAGIGLLIMIFLSFYPLYLQRHKKERYRGIWRWLGEKTQSTQSPVLSIGLLIGWAGGVAIVYSIWGLSGASRMITIIVAVLAMGIYIGIAEYYLHRRR